MFNLQAGNFPLFGFLLKIFSKNAAVVSTNCKTVYTSYMMRTILLLTASNVFMTFAWYYHLKNVGMPLWKAIMLSWGIAFFEYCLMVPANRLGYVSGLSAFQLKMIQEIVTLVVFSTFAVFILKERFRLNYLIAFVFLLIAAYFMFKK